MDRWRQGVRNAGTEGGKVHMGVPPDTKSLSFLSLLSREKGEGGAARDLPVLTL